FSEQELIDSGLFIVRDQPRDGETLFDRFRNRLMFPILDEQARVIGFSGRIIPPSEAKAKYLNSPETLLFKKSRVLYGIDKARKRMTEMRRAVLCEGQLDVIRCHESGITEAVAAQGTAVTDTHAQILKRYSDEVILLLDADAAGVKAALRSADVLLACGITTRVASLPPGEDPDDVVRKYGPKRLCELVESAEPFVVFQVKTLVGQEESITETSRLRVARQVMGSIAKVKEAVHREELIRQAAGALGMREETLRQDLQSTAALQADLPRPRTPTRPPRAPAVVPEGIRGGGRGDLIPPSEKLLIELLLSHPEGLSTARQYVQRDHLGHAEAREILAALYEVPSPTRESILDLCRDHPMGEKLIALDQRSTLRFGSELGTPEEALREIIMILRRESLNRTRKTLHEKNRTITSREEKSEIETEIWKISMHESQLKEYITLREWTKARLLLDMIDSQV
ncbi:MAG: toprim domain-containing protein, partial [Kiritimatiellia bacterium]